MSPSAREGVPSHRASPSLPPSAAPPAGSRDTIARYQSCPLLLLPSSRPSVRRAVTTVCSLSRTEGTRRRGRKRRRSSFSFAVALHVVIIDLVSFLPSFLPSLSPSLSHGAAEQTHRTCNFFSYSFFLVPFLLFVSVQWAPPLGLAHGLQHTNFHSDFKKTQQKNVQGGPSALGKKYIDNKFYVPLVARVRG